MRVGSLRSPLSGRQAYFLGGVEPAEAAIRPHEPAGESWAPGAGPAAVARQDPDVPSATTFDCNKAACHDRLFMAGSVRSRTAAS
jgi:hypothetical protein